MSIDKSKKRKTGAVVGGNGQDPSDEEDVMEDEDEDDDDDDEVEDTNATSMETFDFVGFPVKECDRQMVAKLLMSSVLKDSPINTNQLTDLFIKNTDIATVLKSTNDDDDEEDMDDDGPIAIIGFVHFGRDINETGVPQLKNWLQEKIDIQTNAAVKESATTCLQNNSTALLLSARCINLGGGLVVESLKEMKKDLDAKQYTFNNILIILNMYTAIKSNEETINFLFDEEKVFAENSALQFDFPLSEELQNSVEYIDQSTGKRCKGTPFRRVVGLTKVAFNECLELISAQLQPLL